MFDQLEKPASWRFIRCLNLNQIPLQLKDFLCDPHSTTQRMQQEYNAQVNVNLKRQGWFCPADQEAQLLNIAPRQTALIRETYLYCQNKCWMYARAVFPRNFFVGKNRRLLIELDTRPLGKLLFRDPTLQRTDFEMALLESCHKEYKWATQGFDTNEKLWARRSIFYLQNKPLLLTEVFLPGFFELVKKS